MTEQGTPLSDNIIVWEREDGSILITQMVNDDIDVDAEIEKIKLSQPELKFRMKGKMSETGIAINFFYKALVLDKNNNFAYDMVKAREVWKDILRQLREPKLQELDLLYQRADEDGDLEAKADIIAKKKILRDCTTDPAIAAAKTLNDLRRTLPELLAD